MGKKYDFSIDTNMKTLMTTPEAADVLEKYVKGVKKNPAMKMVYSMTLRAAAAMPAAGVSAETLAKIDEDLRAL